MIATGLTDKGLVRQTNQDSFSVITLSDNIKIAIVCDGMGGASGGNIASNTAALALSSRLSAFESNMSDESVVGLIKSAFQDANETIFNMAKKDPSLSGMGTTAVIALADSNRAFIAHTGDSRAYFINNKGIELLTHDHSVVQEMIDKGQISKTEAKYHPQKNLITRAIGVDSQLEVDVNIKPFTKGDVILLCTDGLTNLVEDHEIQFEVTCGDSIETCPRRLIDIANSRGGNDNITVAIISL